MRGAIIGAILLVGATPAAANLLEVFKYGPFVNESRENRENARLRALAGMPREHRPDFTPTTTPQATPSTFETNGFLQGERDNGGNKLCVYNKYGQSSIITVGKLEMCPR